MFDHIGHPQRSSDPEVLSVCGKWAIGGTGAVGAQTGAKGAVLTRNSAGNYTITLKNTAAVATAVPAFLHASVSLFNSDTDPSNDTDSHFVKMLSISDAGTVSFQCVDEAGVVREAPSGAVISCNLLIKRSSVTR